MRSRHVVAAALLTVAACTDPPRDPVGPSSALAPRAPSLALSDAAHDGRAGFYFRPPLAAALASYPGTFDATLLPSLAVKVCPIDLAGTCTGTVVTFTQSSRPALALNLLDESYGVTWSPSATGDYRAAVYVGATRLGFADVRVVPSGGDVKAVPPGYLGLRRNANLPIKFRTESGIVASISVVAAPAPLLADPTIGIAYVGRTTQTFVATVTDLAGNVVAAPSIAWTSSAPSIATIASSAPSDPTRAVATGLAEGDATITATAGGVSATATLFVIGDLDAVVGASTVFIPRSDVCGRSDGRLCESLVGDVVTDAIRATYPIDFAITNAGGLRANLTCPTTDLASDFCPPYTPPPYPITRGQVVTVMPFGNRVVTLTVTGAELKTMLENGVSAMPSANGRFPQVSGLCFTYDISAPVSARVTGAVRQASDGTCTGAPVDLTAAASYAIAENDFIATGGDGYPPFTGRFTMQTLQDRVVAAWLTTHSPISPTIQGRVKCVTTGATACPPGGP